MISICKAQLVDFVHSFCILYCLHRCRGNKVKAIVKKLPLDTGLNDYLIHKYICHSFIHSDHFYKLSIAPLQVRYYSEALPTQHGYCAGVSRRSATGNCELRTSPRSLSGG